MLARAGIMEIKVWPQYPEYCGETQVPRNAVRRYLRYEAAAELKTPPARPHKLDPFRQYLAELARMIGGQQASFRIGPKKLRGKCCSQSTLKECRRPSITRSTGTCLAALSAWTTRRT